MTSGLTEHGITLGGQHLDDGDRNRAAVWVFVAVEAAALVYYLALSRREWFFGDEWEFLSGRGLGVHDLLSPHYTHWTALPIVIYRLMYWVVGLRSYLPYVALSVGLHLTAAALLRLVMRRAGVAPWIATAGAAAFVCFGPGAQDILWAFQIAFSGALVFGLVDLLLTDHLGSIDRRDWLGLAAGGLALVCSGVAVTMVIVVGIAAVLRRGWRVALFHTAPLGGLYVVWWAGYARGSRSFRGSSRQVIDWTATGVGSVFGALGRVPGVGWLLGVVLLGGLAKLVRASGWRTLCVQHASPVALLLGVPVFFLIAGLDRSGLGVAFARSSRYLHIGAALVLPALAVAIDEILSRSRVCGAVALAALLVGVPGNLGKAHDYVEGAFVRSQPAYRQMMLSVAREPLAREVPASLRPDPGRAPTVTLGWLRAGVTSGRVPKPRPSTPKEALTNQLRLSLMELDQPSGLPCRRVHEPLVRTLAVGDRFGLAGFGGPTGTVLVTLVTSENQPRSDAVSFGNALLNPTPVHTLVAVAGPLTLRIVPAGRNGAILCTPSES
jgi:hypothetical protein